MTYTPDQELNDPISRGIQREAPDDPLDMDYKFVSNIEFDGIDHRDAPDYCDAYICSADYKGEPMTEAQLEKINEDGDFVYEQLMNYLY